MGSDESHFNVSFSEGQSHRTVSTIHSLFEEKGETKRNQDDDDELMLNVLRCQLTY